MSVYDFDINLQKVFYNYFKDIKSANWKNWLDISSVEEYEEAIFKNSKLSSDILEEIHLKKTDPKDFSLNPKTFLKERLEKDDVANLFLKDTAIVTHTSGTSGGDITKLKWFLISDDFLKRVWVPGMQAIFESSGLSKNKSAVIFVPSRIKVDGLSKVEDLNLIRLYTSEFSQRVVLSHIKPSSYLIDEYKNALNILTISKILTLDDISVISAPAATIIKWADLDKLKMGLENSINSIDWDNLEDENSEVFELKKLYERIGLDNFAIEIQNRLSEALKDSTLIFSITSLSKDEWSKIRKFMGWNVGEEKFTNLYVGSEIGPFAGGINKEDNYRMYVFPLTYPVIERKGKKEFISKTKDNYGVLLVSRPGSIPLINIDTGDVITILNQEGIPKISGEILRSGFKLKLEMKLEGFPKNTEFFAGDYFDIGGIEVFNPRKMVSCMGQRFGLEKDNPVLLVSGESYKMVLPLENNKNVLIDKIKEEMPNCSIGQDIEEALKNEKISLEMGNTNVKSSIDHAELLEKVKKGDLPKGVLKKWPFYILNLPKNSEI
uniref:GH3 auxin-responsive promoter n=1 Tax=Methanococcus maripaludis (strain C6 / ATCC BAA-1332) TaxID=444158 RepID=A9A6H6_METM6